MEDQQTATMIFVALLFTYMLRAVCVDSNSKTLQDIGDGIKALASHEYKIYPDESPSQIVASILARGIQISAYLFDVGGSGVKVAILDTLGMIHVLGLKLNAGYKDMDLMHNAKILLRNVRQFLQDESLYKPGAALSFSQAGDVNQPFGYGHLETKSSSWTPGTYDGKVFWGPTIDFNKWYQGLDVSVGSITIVSDSYAHTLGLLHTTADPTDFSVLNLTTPILSLAIGSGVGVAMVSPEGNQMCASEPSWGSIVWWYHGKVGSNGYKELALASDFQGLSRYLHTFFDMLERLLRKGMYGHTGTVIISGGAVSTSLGEGLLRSMLIHRLRTHEVLGKYNVRNVVVADFESGLVGAAVARQLLKAGVKLTIQHERREACLGIPEQPRFLIICVVVFLIVLVLALGVLAIMMVRKRRINLKLPLTSSVTELEMASKSSLRQMS